MSKETEVMAVDGDCRWYAIKTKIGHEIEVLCLIERLKDSRFADVICDVAVTTACGVLHTASGIDKKNVEVLWPGYLFVQMNYDYAAMDCIGHMTNVCRFVGSNAPQPMTRKEMQDAGLCGPSSSSDPGVGDEVVVARGSLKDLKGTVKEVNGAARKAKVTMTLFDRDIEAEVDLDEIKKAA